MTRAKKRVSVVIYNADGSILSYTIPKGATPSDSIGSVYTQDIKGNWTADNRTNN